MSPATWARPPGRPAARTTTGGQPESSSLTASAPSCPRASRRSWMGRSLMRAVPFSRKRPWPSAATAVRNRTVVPLLPTMISAPPPGGRPPQPVTRIVCSAGSCPTETPSCPRPAIITRVSSLSRAPLSSERPPAKAAQTRARLVMLFEPGGRIEPWIGPQGWISMASVIVGSIPVEGFWGQGHVARAAPIAWLSGCRRHERSSRRIEALLRLRRPDSIAIGATRRRPSSFILYPSRAPWRLAPACV